MQQQCASCMGCFLVQCGVLACVVACCCQESNLEPSYQSLLSMGNIVGWLLSCATTAAPSLAHASFLDQLIICPKQGIAAASSC